VKKKFSESSLKEIQEITSRYPSKRSAILPVLHLAQREFGFIDNEIVELIAGRLGVEPLHVEEALGFYTMFDRSPTGRYVMRVCTNISCSLLGSGGILEYLEKRLGISRGFTTPDGLITLQTVECLGACGSAPVMMINDEYHDNMDIEKVEGILRNLGA